MKEPLSSLELATHHVELRNMERKKELTAKLNEIRGKILSNSVEIESRLTLRIQRFFYPKQNEKATAFYWHILNTRKFSFEDKIQLFEKIPYFRRLKNYDSFRNSLRFVKRLRNQLAHWELIENKSKLGRLVLRSPISVDDVIIDKQLLEEFDKHKGFLLSKLW